MEQMFVSPAPGVKVRDPQTLRHIPDAGQLVPRDSFWLRRLADGDVVEHQSRPDEEPPKKASRSNS